MSQDSTMDNYERIAFIGLGVLALAAVALLAFNYGQLLQLVVNYCTQYVCK